MVGTLIRVLSSGRTGTRFIANLFAEQGYVAFHEDLYVGEPSSAVLEYLRMLGDLWRQDRNAYFSFESNFAQPYVRTVLQELRNHRTGSPGASLAQVRRMLRAVRERRALHRVPGVVVDASNAITPASPLIQRACLGSGLDIRYIILLRNPIKTVHAIHQVESAACFAHRPRSFAQGSDSLVRAANVWANTYDLILDQQRELGSERFVTLELERLNADADYAPEIFCALGLKTNRKIVESFTQKVSAVPLRSAKFNAKSRYALARNSDLYADRQFVFSREEVKRIIDVISRTITACGLDPGKCAEEYAAFHEVEKARLGFEPV